MATEREKEDAALKQQIADLQKQQAKFAEEIDAIIKKAPIPNANLTAYLDNPENFPPGQFDAMKRQQKAKKEGLLAQFGLAPTEKHAETPEVEKEKKTKQKSAPARKKWLKLD